MTPLPVRQRVAGFRAGFHAREGRHLRIQVKGEPERVYKTGESFYEPPNGVHLVSANASGKNSAKLIAYFVCDHDTPLSVAVPETHASRGELRISETPPR